MFQPLAGLMAWFYDIWPSYGGTIILLTLAVMIVLTPLTLRGTRSMLRMQRLQPEMKRIQKEFKDDRQRQNEELMKFYKDNGINPLSSCLPLLIQMPVFIILYRVLHGLTQSTGGVTEACPDGGCFEPKYLDHSTSLYESLISHSQLNWLGFDLAISPSKALSEGFGTFLPYGIMIIIVLVSGYVQQAQIQGRSQNQQSTNPQQQMIMKILPLFIGVISFGLPGALVLYFVTSNLFRVGQQFLITHTIYKDDAEAAGVIDVDSDEKPKDKPKKLDSGNGSTSSGTKGKPTPPRGGGPSSNGKPKGSNKRTTTGRSDNKGSTSPSLPQPRPRKKKR
jgi:YidC/Oxa1 family membrane protein insertase